MLRVAAQRAVFAVAVVALVAGCPEDPPPAFPEDYASTYREARDCRPSADHDLHNIRVLADPLAFEPYALRATPFPEGAVVLKEEFDFGDVNCADAPIGWTVMVRLAATSSTRTLDWHWQKVDEARRVVTDNEPRCFACHVACVPPDGYGNTCAVP